MNEIINKIISKVDTNTPLGLKALTSLIILTFSFVFTHIFIFDLELFDDFPTWLLYLLIFVSYYFIQMILFSGDILYTGKPEVNKYVKIFQKKWPSRYIAEKFEISIKDANYYWFQNFFNKWKKSESNMNEQVKRTFKRGYECRLVYYCIRFFQTIFVFSLIMIIVHNYQIFLLLLGEKVKIEFSDIQLQIGFIILILLIYMLIYLSNNPIYNNPKGVWQKYNEINEFHRKWIDDNIKSVDDLKNKSN